MSFYFRTVLYLCFWTKNDNVDDVDDDDDELQLTSNK